MVNAEESTGDETLIISDLNWEQDGLNERKNPRQQVENM